MAARVLTELQEKVLEILFGKGLDARDFYLTGGTALSAFYLRHRISDDLDFFTRKRDSLQLDCEYVREVLNSSGFDLDQQVLSADFARFFLRTRETDSESLKIEFARDAGAMMGSAVRHGSIVVDSFEDIAVNKVCAILGREPPESKDFVDLFFILEDSKFTVDYLAERAKEKEAAFEGEDGLLYFATNLLRVEDFQRLPRMLRPVDLPTLTRRLRPIGEQILNRLHPAKG
ncbi:MAG: nucleotidyl transferase AbiEii/AbiGii toxin family protein [Planctomycetes bacterium]|nr:nucleotidyl transferase AbiEii/AbiGii toxin family protein [Planctomycetota bacterium]